MSLFILIILISCVIVPLKTFTHFVQFLASLFTVGHSATLITCSACLPSCFLQPALKVSDPSTLYLHPFPALCYSCYHLCHVWLHLIVLYWLHSILYTYQKKLVFKKKFSVCVNYAAIVSIKAYLEALKLNGIHL